MRRLLGRLTFFLLVLVAAPSDAGQEFFGRVTRVFDGDTLEVSSGARTRRIRLFGIDAPEREQHYGLQASQYASRLARGKRVTVEVKDLDSYGRIVGEVRLPDGRSLNREMISSGHAWWYRRYSEDPELGRLERKARLERRGLWREPDPLPPWIFRRQAG